MSISISEACDKFMQFPDTLTDVTTVTRHGKPVLASIAWDLYAGRLETLEILADSLVMDSINHSLQDAEDGKTIDLDHVMEDLASLP